MEHNGFLIKPHANFAMYEISRIGKGAVPVKLRGLYSSTREAVLSINAVKTPRGDLNAKKSDSSGGK